MIVRDNSRINVNSAEHEVVKRNILDLYIVTGNASACYAIFRRAVSGEPYNENRANASNWFKRDDNVSYMEGRAVEIARRGFEEYARLKGLDISEFKKTESKYSDIESLTTDELRTKNLVELEGLKEETDDPKTIADIIKQQTDLMNAKRRDETNMASEDLIHFHLPYPICNTCPHAEKLRKKK